VLARDRGDYLAMRDDGEEDPEWFLTLEAKIACCVVNS